MLQTYDAGVEIRAMTFDQQLTSAEEETKVLMRRLRPPGFRSQERRH